MFFFKKKTIFGGVKRVGDVWFRVVVWCWLRVVVVRVVKVYELVIRV